jgi:hypothetical protein
VEAQRRPGLGRGQAAGGALALRYGADTRRDDGPKL